MDHENIQLTSHLCLCSSIFEQACIDILIYTQQSFWTNYSITNKNKKKKSFTYVSTGQSSIHSSPRELLNTLLITHSKGKLLVGSTCPLTTSEYFNFKESNGKNKQTNKKSVICILSQFRMTKIYQHPSSNPKLRQLINDPW